MVVYWIHLPGQNIKTDGYVGVSSRVKQRWTKHKCLASNSRHLSNAILKYGEQLIWEVVYEGTTEGCLQLEEYWRPNTDIGWNIRRGGQYGKMSEHSKNIIREKLTGNTNASGHTMSSEVIEKLRNINIGNSYRLGQKMSEATKAKIKASRTGVKLNLTPESRDRLKQRLLGHQVSDETRAKISKAQKGTLMGKDNPKSKKVLCEETGEVYHGILDASRILNITSSNISSCCRGITKTAGGYHWSYYKEL